MTTDELKDHELWCQVGFHPELIKVVKELLRRERERCARACDAIVVEIHGGQPTGSSQLPLVAGMCAAAIRDLP